MRRVAILSEQAPPLAAAGRVEGLGRSLYIGQFAKRLAEHGYEADVFTRRNEAALPDIVDWAPGVRVVHVPTAGPAASASEEDVPPWMDDFVENLLVFFGQQGRPYDLLHAGSWISALAAARVKRRSGIPFVFAFTESGTEPFSSGRDVIEEEVAAQADRLVVQCPQDLEDMAGLYGADPGKAAVVPPGFDPEEFFPVDRSLARAALGLPQNERLLLSVGRLVPDKGVDTVIRGFARLIYRHRLEARLLVVGGAPDGPDAGRAPEEARLKEEARREGVFSRVHFAGGCERDLLKYYYSAADMFVAMPRRGPFGTTPLESMSCGTPVIGARVAGMRSAVLDGETGYLVPPNDVEFLACRMAELCRQPRLAELMGRRAARRVRDKFKWPMVVRAMKAVYGQVLKSASGPSRRKSRRAPPPALERALGPEEGGSRCV